MAVTAERLYEAYSSRKDTWKEDLAKARAQATREILETALVNADLCIKVFVSIAPEVKAWIENLRRLTESVLGNQQKVAQLARESAALIQSIQELTTSRLLTKGCDYSV